MESEIWKLIPDAPDYEASSLGRIRRAKPDSCGRAMKVLRPAVKTTGRLQVSICRDRTIKAEMVNRLVAKAFHGLPPIEYPLCCHVDGDCLNNRPENLYWGNASTNGIDARRHGTIANGERNGNSKTNAATIRAIRVDRRSSSIIASETGLHFSTICRIRRGEAWAHVD